MNSQMINVKAHYNGNIRRFQSQALWTVLSQDLQALFSIDSPVLIHYRDDENDLCQISSQMELEFAATLSKNLQVFITKPENVQITVVAPAPSVPVKESCPEPEVPVHFRGGRLTARLANIQKKLESDTLPANRRAMLMIKKAKIEEAILRAPVDAPKQQEMVVVPEQPNRPCRGRRNPSDRLLAINQALSNPNLPPKRRERLELQKTKLEAHNSEVAPVPVVTSIPLVPLRGPAVRGPAARLLAIEKILAQPDLHPRRVEKLQEKKAKLEEILRERANNDSPAPEVVCTPRCRGPQARLAMIEKILAQPDLPARKLERLQEKKAKLEKCLETEKNSPAQVQIPVTRRVCRGPETRLAAINSMLESNDLHPRRRQKLLNQKAMLEERINDCAVEALPMKNCQGRQRGARFTVVKRK